MNTCGLTPEVGTGAGYKVVQTWDCYELCAAWRQAKKHRFLASIAKKTSAVQRLKCTGSEDDVCVCALAALHCAHGGGGVWMVWWWLCLETSAIA